jgi:FSR family fosmidomycin resistance protein-like MFS transporter
MAMTSTSAPAPAMAVTTAATFPILVALSVAHLLNDMIQSLIPAIYPIIKQAYGLDFGQIGLITLTFQLTASLFQPLVGMYTDKYPQPFSMVAGMGFTLTGLIVLAHAGSYAILLLGAALVGSGSAIFHPEATRMARIASGGRLGLAQGLFQVGGQTGGALGPLLAAFIVVPNGQGSLTWFSLVALIAMVVLFQIGLWHSRHIRAAARANGGVAAPAAAVAGPVRETWRIGLAIAVLVILLFSKNAYSASFGSYYTFYLIERFGVSVQTSQLMLFVFLVSAAAGALIGGYLGDRFGRRKIIWFSILGALPFTLALPYASLAWTPVLTVIINLIMSSAFAAILVYAMELLPGRVGLIGGLFYGLSFGLGGLAAALLGELADRTSVDAVYKLCSFLPLVGLVTWFLPRIERR